MKYISIPAFCLICVATGGARAALPSAIVWGETACELSVNQISPITAQIVLAPLDAGGRALQAPTTAAFLSVTTNERLRTRELAERREIKSGQLRITIAPHPMTITVRKAGGDLVQKLVFAESTNGSMSFQTEAPVFGLGEGERQFDRRGLFYPMVSGQRARTLGTYGGTIPVPFLIGADGWSLFVRGPWGSFDLRGPQGLFVPDPKLLGREPLTLYVSALNEPADALSQFALLTGHPVMPPKWTLGYIQSHRTLRGPDDAVDIARKFRDERLPVDAVIYLGTGYCPLGWNLGHGSLEFNPKSFPQPAEQIRALHDLNLKVILHINHAPRGLFGLTMTQDSDSPNYIGNYWKGHVADMALGVDGWWPDDGDELPIESRLARHLCYYEGALQTRPNTRPWSLHRNGYAGAVRDGGWIWSGDTESRWVTLAAHVPVGLNTGLSLTPFWGSDIGGFHPTSELTGELYTRWFEYSAFTPLFRSHGVNWHLRLPWGWNTGEMGPVESSVKPAAAELTNAAVEPICRQYLELRYRLLPYNYTLAREAADSALPLMRALWLYYPADEQAVKVGDEYLWGRDLLVAPVVEKGATHRRVYLPKGEWYDWWTGESAQGAAWVDRPVNLATIPIFVRAGAIMVLDPVRQYTSETVDGPATVTVYPGADGTFTLYDDDGTSLGYRDGSDSRLEWIHFRWNDHARQLTIEPDARMKKWPGPMRDFSVQIAGGEKSQSVRFSGKRITVKLSMLEKAASKKQN